RRPDRIRAAPAGSGSTPTQLESKYLNSVAGVIANFSMITLVLPVFVNVSSLGAELVPAVCYGVTTKFCSNVSVAAALVATRTAAAAVRRDFITIDSIDVSPEDASA